MPSINVTKVFKFSAAHQLPNYEGLCGHIHGHNYTLEVTVGSAGLQPSGNEEGMVMEAFDIKQIVAPLLESLDHSLIVEIGVMQYKTMTGRVYQLGKSPTTENLAEHIFNYVQDRMPSGRWLSKIRLQETDTIWVEVSL